MYVRCKRQLFIITYGNIIICFTLTEVEAVVGGSIFKLYFGYKDTRPWVNNRI